MTKTRQDNNGVIISILNIFSFQVNDKPLVPTACSASNQGRCECGDTSRGFQTYTFWMENVQRCFTVFHPTSRASEKLPVLIQPNCYAEDRLGTIHILRNHL